MMMQAMSNIWPIILVHGRYRALSICRLSHHSQSPPHDSTLCSTSNPPGQVHECREREVQRRFPLRVVNLQSRGGSRLLQGFLFLCSPIDCRTCVQGKDDGSQRKISALGKRLPTRFFIGKCSTLLHLLHHLHHLHLLHHYPQLLE